MEEYWFLAPILRLAISSASLNIFFSEALHDNLPVTLYDLVGAKQVGRLMKKTVSCKKVACEQAPSKGGKKFG